MLTTTLPFRCAFYVSGGASRLRKLLDEPPSPLLHDTALVISDSLRNEDLRPLLATRNISFVCVDFERLAPARRLAQAQLSQLLLAQFEQHEIHHCFSFGDHLLEGALLVRYENRIVNFHPSLLPHFRGRKAIDQARDAGAFLLGNTAHYIDNSMDGGPVIMQSVLPATEFQARGYDAVLDAQLPMVHQIHQWLREDRIRITPQGVNITHARPAAIAFFPPLDHPGPVA